MKQTIILSFDALGQADSDYFQSLDGFKYIIDNGAYIEEMETVYPSLTYPCHTSIVTGRYPRDHGVVNNLLLQPSLEKKDWYWYEKYIEGDTIFRAAKRKGMKVGTILWPVAAKANIDWLIPEILPHGLLKNMSLIALANGSPRLLAKMERKHGDKRQGISQPELDNYTEACLHDFIRSRELDIIGAHFIAVDDKKHKHGTQSHELKLAIDTYNDRINNLLALLEKEKIEANVFIISDHSQLDVHSAIRLNSFFNEKGYLQIKDGRIFKYKYYMQEAGGSAYIYSNKTTSREDSILRKELEDLNGDYNFFDAIYTAYEAEELGADPSCLFMIEAKEGYFFKDGHEGHVLDESNLAIKATHGYSPHKDNYCPVLFAIGPDIKETRLGKGRLIDIGPTISKLLRLGLKGASGRPLDIIKNDLYG